MNLNSTKNNKSGQISIKELSSMLTISPFKVYGICNQLGIYVIKKRDKTYINRKTPEYSDTLLVIENHIANSRIEEEMIEYINENQPVTPNRISLDLNINPKVVRRVLADITFLYPLLWCDEGIAGEELYYGYEGWEEKIAGE